jgi:hypothetical protein
VEALQYNLSNLNPIEFSRDHTRKIHSLNLKKAKELESKNPKIRKKTHLTFKTYNIKNEKFIKHLKNQNFFENEDKRNLGEFGEMGSYDFEDEEKSIEKHKLNIKKKLLNRSNRKGESFCIHRDDFKESLTNRKLSMIMPSKHLEPTSFNGMMHNAILMFRR